VTLAVKAGDIDAPSHVKPLRRFAARLAG